MEQPQPQINIKKLEELLRTINSAERKSELYQRYPDDKLLNLYNAWNSLEEHDKKQLEVDKYSPISEAPTRVLLSPNSTTYRDISTNPNTQIRFAQDHLVKLMKFTPYQESVVRTMKLRAVADADQDEEVAHEEVAHQDEEVDDQAVAEIIPAMQASKAIDEILETGEVFIQEARVQLQESRSIVRSNDANFLKLNAVFISETIMLIINFMLLIFCCLLQLSQLLSREDIQSSPDVKRKISLLGKALMQYYTNFFTLIATLIGLPIISEIASGMGLPSLENKVKTWVPNAKKITWFQTCVIIFLFICIRIVLHNKDPNDIIIQVVMFPILGALYCADVGLKISGYKSMFLSRVVWLDNVIKAIPETIKNVSYEAALHYIKNKALSSISSILTQWLQTEGRTIMAEELRRVGQEVGQEVGQRVVEGVSERVVLQIAPALEDAVAHQFQVAIPQITAAAQTNLLEFREILSHGLDSCQVITQQQAEILARISDDPTTLEQFSRSLSWWGNLVQENAIKALIQGALAVRGNPQIGYRGGRKTRKYRKNYKNYKNKTKIHRKKQTHKRYRKKAKKGKKSKKY
jgi:hypothetical protein